ncbi:MAG: DNA polymerase clamp loader subunit A [Proteobacteria bacterium]|nr:DNA polymerase clamp loader subunit A [Pseudomonadota bacterium]
MKLGDYLKAINYTKEPLMNSEDTYIEKQYLPFIVNRCLSFFPDTIIQTNEMNLHNTIDKKMQFDFLMGTIRKSKRFSPWIKEELPENIEIVKEYFGYNNKKAKEALDILSKEDIEKIKIKLSKGGIS